MKKTLKKTGGVGLCALAVLLSIPSPVWCQQEANQEDVFLARQGAVMLVSQSVFLDGTKIRDVRLFEKLEKAMGRKVRDQYFPVSNGTSFAISPDGYLVTAFHVIKHVPLDQVEGASLRSFAHYIGKHLVPGYLERTELNKVLNEFKRITDRPTLYVVVKTAAGEVYRAETVAKDDDQDLALLKIEAGPSLPTVPLAEATALKASQKVVSIGYPLQDVLDEFLDDLKSSVTNGIISAVRRDKWDIQHTAFVNPGNSGGPLLDASGGLIGINVGAVTDANGIYFAVGSQKLIDWLTRINKLDAVEMEGK